MTSAGPIEKNEDDLASGTRIGRYRVEDPVGRGGMGVVYRAFDETTNRNVALKLLSKGIPAPLRERFLAECEAEANIRHEHIMPVYDRGWLTDEQPYFAMELLYEPITLGEVIEQVQASTLGSTHTRLRAWNDLRRLVGDVLVPICEGVHVANAEYGIQHRDLKPDNVLIDIRTRRAYLIDFGICRNMDDRSDVGRVVGTPRFLSPEQARGRVDPRTDVWGLGALLHYAVSGEPPLEGTSPFTRKEVSNRIEALRAAEAKAQAAGENAKARGFAGRRRQLEDPELRVQEDLMRDAIAGRYLPLPASTNASLLAIIQKAMAVASEDRYDTAGDLAADLRSWLKGGSVQAVSEAGAGSAVVDLARRLLNRNVMRGAGALVALALGLIVGAGLFTQTPPAPDHRQVDAAADLEALDAQVAEWVTQAAATSGPRVGPLGCAYAYALTQRWREPIDRRLAAAGGDASVASAASFSAQRLDSRMAPARLALEGLGGERWTVEDIFQVSAGRKEVTGPRAEVPPGVYLLEGGERVPMRLRVAVPAQVPPAELAISLPARRAPAPPGMTWIPAGPAGGAAGNLPAFLAMPGLVTNEKYSEWLDELPAEERDAHIPPAGFQKDAGTFSRWLVRPGMGNRPVRGVSGEDARAYAAWRSEVEGLALTLPSAAQWRRMAAIDMLDGPGATLLFPWKGTLPWRAQMQRGVEASQGGLSRRFRDASPHGIHQLFAGGGEIVRGDGRAFALVGKGGILPHATALLRSEPIAGDARAHAYGFRLVHRPP